MLITRKSMMSGKVHTKDIAITEDEIRRWQGGELAQSVWPHLSADDREFIMTGTTKEEWDAVFGGE